MYTIGLRNSFKKDYKLCLKRGYPEKEIEAVMTKLMAGEALPAKYRAHRLSGDYAECEECHIRPDWLLIYIRDDETMRLEFVRTGTHSDLF